MIKLTFKALLLSSTLATSVMAAASGGGESAAVVGDATSTEHSPLSSVSFVRRNVETSHGKISFIETNPDNPSTIVCIHGNSASATAFKYQLSLPYHVISFDLPGHGESGNSIKPITELEVPGHEEGAEPMKISLCETYSYPGYAAALIEALDILGITNAIISGWSLGGHAAFEVLAQRPDLVSGLVTTGAPPIPLTEEGLGKGFNFVPMPEGTKTPMDMIGEQAPFTKEDAEHFLDLGGFGTGAHLKELVDAGMRTDGMARKCMFNAVISGIGVDATEVISKRDRKTQVAFIGGIDDSGINNEYIKAFAEANGAEFHMVPGGHACFYTDSEPFNTVLMAFADKVFGKKA